MDYSSHQRETCCAVAGRDAALCLPAGGPVPQGVAPPRQRSQAGHESPTAQPDGVQEGHRRPF